MTVENNAHIQELLRQLRSRDLTESEWAQLGRYSEDDAFLSDALEGLKEVPNEQRMHHLSNIEKHITQSRAKRRSAGIYRWVSAAAVLLILVMAAILRDRLDPPDLSTMAEAEQTEPFEEVDQNGTRSEQFSPSQDMDNSNVNEDQMATSKAADQEIPSASEQERITSTPPPSDIASAENEPEPQSAISSYPTAAESPEAAQTSDDELAQAPAQKNSRGEATTYSVDGIRVSNIKDSMSSQQNAHDKTIDDIALNTIHVPEAADKSTLAQSADGSEPIKITGMVTDDSEQPIVGAQVVLSGSRIGTNTDFDGKFTLVIPEGESFDNSDLVVSYMGFETKTIKLNEARDINVELQSGMELNEVVVTGMGRKQARTKKNTPPENVAYALASPVDGWKSYFKYIRKEIKTPSAAQDAGIEGTVGLEFDLDEEGVPTEFRVVQSLGYGCDEEAIRLVRDGPRWNVEEAQVPIGRIDIDF